MGRFRCAACKRTALESELQKPARGKRGTNCYLEFFCRKKAKKTHTYTLQETRNMLTLPTLNGKRNVIRLVLSVLCTLALSLPTYSNYPNVGVESEIVFGVESEKKPGGDVFLHLNFVNYQESVSL